ncbi:PTS lactose/cellobiose transporter subunit IIA [Bacillus cereus group sp. MYBK12-2]|uniref:PTS system lactose-specific EIIA component n=4 Tax=Bacillus cereus group TaxID=86661 RepID=A0A150AUS2_BACCE|nr:MULTISPECIES: PTS lactose/cellobiose transporter subunit IIA [Bacillus cereus group]EEK41919.1 Lactose-specific phosphotransferase enzyme IIA component [Bacillus cereus m1293]MBQ6447064.1 PTS lactose/cellobiose transporter subunit IIA [Bacillus sp. (in: firmicutes)]MBR3118784.1 PTS lactose/cellobiose transporter subunit IIA [Oceanobacillus sp.]HDR7337306.1 PTS lactose/cellobiose transporter subunit IIA [Bacillus anthracis]EOP98540.1 PTS system, lactose-specific IIa component [Bacillus cereu
MNKEEVSMVGFEIVAFAGEARSKLLQAVNEAKKSNLDAAEGLVKEAKESLAEAHNSQTQILAAEAGGESVELGFIMVHAQDHLMTTLLLSDIVEHLIEIYTKG